MYLASTVAANALLERDPLALLIGMLLDQQVPMEKAFTSPEVLAERLGVDELDAAALADAEPERFAELFKGPPALHRFPGAMAARTQALCRIIADEYAGDAAAVWSGADSGTELIARLERLPGFGEVKARIFGALLGKQFGVRPDGWKAACGEFAEPGFRSVADVVDEESLGAVRAHKKEMKAAKTRNKPKTPTPTKAATGPRPTR